MRVLVVYAHPAPGSYQAAVHRCVVTSLTEAGHDVDDCDLYAEGFQPVLSRDEWERYYNTPANRTGVEKEVDRLLACEALVIVFPTWWYGMPAILKGYFERVWLPGVAFEIVGGRIRPMLHNISRLVVVTTYGSPWWLNALVLGNPVRKVFMRGVRLVLSPHVKRVWLALYGLDHIGHRARERFLKRVAAQMRSF